MEMWMSHDNGDDSIGSIKRHTNESATEFELCDLSMNGVCVVVGMFLFSPLVESCHFQPLQMEATIITHTHTYTSSSLTRSLALIT